MALADKISPPVTVVAQDPPTLGAPAALFLFAPTPGDSPLPRRPERRKFRAADLARPA